jgi:proline iminopeptidase
LSNFLYLLSLALLCCKPAPIKSYIDEWKRRCILDRETDQFQTYLDYELNKSTVCDTSKILKAEAGGGFYAQLMTFKDLRQVQDVRGQIQNSNIPVLVMKGQCDNQKWGYTKEYLDIFPNHRLVVVPNAGHLLSVEQPEICLISIKKFLDK